MLNDDLKLGNVIIEKCSVFAFSYDSFILILCRFAKAKLLRMSYTERNSSIKIANTEKSVQDLFRLGITTSGT
jgi:hypothetical protein